MSDLSQRGGAVSRCCIDNQHHKDGALTLLLLSSGAYVPEGLLTSCTWDYMTFTPSVRAYTMLLFIFVFFLPLFIIIYCYVFIFRAIRATNQSVCVCFHVCGVYHHL